MKNEEYYDAMEEEVCEDWWNARVERFLNLLQQSKGKKIKIDYYNGIASEIFDVDCLINTFNEDWFDVVRNCTIL